MKKLIINCTCFLVIMLGSMFLLESKAFGQSCTTTCTSSYGCDVTVAQTSMNWVMSVTCDGATTEYAGSGDYSGTICGGVEPCNVPMQPEVN